MSGYRKFSDTWQESPEGTLGGLGALGAPHAQTSKNAVTDGLVYPTTHTIDMINVFPSTADQSKTQPAPSPPPKVPKAPKPQPLDWWLDQYEERAAIRQYDGRYSRAEAERLAWGALEVLWHKEK